MASASLICESEDKTITYIEVCHMCKQYITDQHKLMQQKRKQKKKKKPKFSITAANTGSDSFRSLIYPTSIPVTKTTRQPRLYKNKVADVKTQSL
ncbi:hypothetical protein TorRG33x02_174120 [Trema orientale]|uniref:Uncharacterized protein n=1 Tax=Trema orientale TaxID=63057 RepID=A0A2P5EMJ9_TREOI|nr:hypothetical protein TorRG33x02_174120 [Trema orientale]